MRPTHGLAAVALMIPALAAAQSMGSSPANGSAPPSTTQTASPADPAMPPATSTDPASPSGQVMSPAADPAYPATDPTAASTTDTGSAATPPTGDDQATKKKSKKPKASEPQAR